MVGVVGILRVPWRPRPRRPHSKTVFVNSKRIAVTLKLIKLKFLVLICDSNQQTFESGRVNLDNRLLLKIFLENLELDHFRSTNAI